MTEENEEQARLEKLRQRSRSEERNLDNPYRDSGLSSTEVILSRLKRGDEITDPGLKKLWQAFEDLPD